jgi:small subunit ribosomal protein S9
MSSPNPPAPGQPTPPPAAAPPAGPAPVGVATAAAPGGVAGATAAAAPAPNVVVSGIIWATGRRKSAVARVRLMPGDGKITVNEEPFNEFFKTIREQNDVLAPLKAVKMTDKVAVIADVKGGGPVGQAGAVLLGIARALKQVDPALEHALRDGGYLTRDDRKKERKKYGRRGARRRFQFSKR